MTIGQRIKQRRNELSLSVEEISHRLGKNRATIYRYESDDIQNLPAVVLEPLAQILETTPAALMGWEKQQDEIDRLGHSIESLDKRVDFYTNFRTILNILGYELTTRYGETEQGLETILLEDKSTQLEIPNELYRSMVNTSLSYIEFQLKDLIKEYSSKK